MVCPPSSEQAEGTHSSRRLWVVFICAITGSFLVHEIGHCAVAWVHGYAAVPTPMKEYILGSIPQSLQNQVALGGILGSVTALLGTMFWFYRKPGAVNSSLLAGAMTAPGCYSLRFILFGRGHDASEFQEAQAALGLSYNGHAIDWLFVALLVVASAFWFWRTRPSLTVRLAVRVMVGSVVALLVLVLLQSINNAIFDPVFAPQK